MKLLTKTFTENVFDNTYYVCVGEEKDAEKWLEKKIKGYQPKIDGSYACALHHEGKIRRTIIFFCTEAWQDKEYCNDTISHEALHATIRSLMQHGIKFDENNHEIFCYTLGWIVRNINKLKK